MNNRFPFVSLVLFIAFLAGAVYIATVKMPEKRAKIYGRAEARMQHCYMPVAGLEKFYADAQWIATVQEMSNSSGNAVAADGTRLSPEAEEQQRKKDMQKFCKRFTWLSDIAPDIKNIYEIGVMFIANDLPQEALDLLRKGSKLTKDQSYSFPLSQVHIINNIISRNDETKRLESRDEVINLLAEAMKCPGVPDYVQNQWLRAKAEKEGYGNDSLDRLRLWSEYYKSKIRVVYQDGEETASAAGHKEGEGAYFADSEQESALRNQVMQMAQTLALENFKKRQTAKGKDLEKAVKEHREINKIFFSVAPEGHYSEESLFPYEAGDLFDVYTGTPVKPYGVDPDMLQQGKIVLYKGSFSQVTGKPRNEDYSKFKHEDFLKKVLGK